MANSQDEIESFGFLSEREQEPVKEPLDERDLLNFAAWVLLFLGITFVASMVLYFCKPENGKAIFEICSHGIPPIVTLILGYYFSRK